MGSYLSKPTVVASLFALGTLAVSHWYNWIYRFPKGAVISRGYLPIVGHLFRLFGSTDHNEMVRDFDNFKTKTCVFGIPMVPWFIFTKDPQNVQYILKTNFENFPKGSMMHDIFEDLLGDGIFNADGMSWYHQRKTSSPMFSTNVLRSHFHVFEERIAELIDVLKDTRSQTQSPQELYSTFNRFTLECIGEIGFGVKIGCLRDSSHPFLAAFDSAQELSAARFLNPFWKLCRLIGTSGERKLAQCVKAMDKFTYSLIAERRTVVRQQIEEGLYDNDKIIQTVRRARETAINRANRAPGAASPRGRSTIASPRDSVASTVPNTPEKNNANKKAEGDMPTRNFLSLFIASNPDMSDKELRDAIVSLLIAGRDTTAQTLSWAFWELLQHPEVVEKLREELRTVCKEAYASAKPGEIVLPTFDQIRSQLPYMTAFVHEVLRLHPPVPRNPKQAFADCYLPDGTFIPAGSTVMYSAWAMGRDKELWGEDALTFRPERWIEMDHLPSNYKWPAFQGGDRECLGRAMALFEIRATLAGLLSNFNFTPACDLSEHTFQISATLGMTPGLFVDIEDYKLM